MSWDRMRAVVCSVAILAVCAAGPSGCTSDCSALTHVSAVTTDGTGTTETIANHDAAHVVLKVDSTAFWKYYCKTIDELNSSEAVEVIIRGEVVGTRDVYIEHAGQRILTVDVNKVYKGESAQQITVYEDGGIVPLKEVLPDMEGHYDPASLSEDDIENGLVDFRYMGAEHSQVGDKVILYLRVNPNESQAGSYQMIMGPYSCFKLDELNSTYARPGEEGVPSFETERSEEAMEAALEELKAN
jgi:hypothetical protein